MYENTMWRSYMDAGNVVIKVLSLISSLLNPSKDILGNYIYLANVTIFLKKIF